MSSGRVQARVNPRLKAQAESIIRRSGYTVSGLVTVLYSHIVVTKKIPVNVEQIPNDITLKAMRDSLKGNNLKVYNNAEEGLVALGLNKKITKNSKR